MGKKIPKHKGFSETEFRIFNVQRSIPIISKQYLYNINLSLKKKHLFYILLHNSYYFALAHIYSINMYD